MSETWVFVVTDPDKMIDFAALALHEGWLRSCYRVKDEDRLTAQSRTHSYAPLKDQEVYDQDA
jgi:hypothetical protein